MNGNAPHAIARRRGRGTALPILAAFLLVLWLPAGTTAAGPAPPDVLSLQLHDAIQPVTARYVVESLRLAEREGCSLVVLNLETPGGLMDSTQVIVDAIRSSPCRWPSSYRAPARHRRDSSSPSRPTWPPWPPGPGSAPPTRWGCWAGAVTRRDGDPDAEGGERRRGLDPLPGGRAGKECGPGEEAVRQSRAFTEKEALEGGLIDLIAADERALLKSLDGKEVRRSDQKTVTLQLAGAKVRKVAMSARERFLPGSPIPTS